MVRIKAFKAIRPREELAKQVAALPYDVISSEEARELVKDNPYSFLHVDKAEIDLEQNIDIYSQKVYEKAQENLYEMISKNILLKDNKEKIYIYSQTMNEHTQTGIVACASIDDYINNTIRKHEFTREVKEKDRANHIKYCNANTGPIFLTYKKNKIINKFINEWCESNNTIYSFKSEDNIVHKVWEIDDDNLIEFICKNFKEIGKLYIADGHHRAAAAVKVGLQKRKENKNYIGNEEFNYFLCVIFPKDDLKIIDYNRVVRDLNGLNEKEFFAKISKKFIINEIAIGNKYKPQSKHCFGMYLDGIWYELRLKKELLNGLNEINSLDVSILQENILKPILGIENPREDERIDFIGGIKGAEELEGRVNKDMKLAFMLYPTIIEEVINIADKGDVMPPKSTWFEPKLRSGLFIHEI
ncbi:MAG: DUF1015 domain-containing protein [Sarcina sp.]